MLSVVIQAGGRSERMGRDKALLPFLGQPLISRLVLRLRNLTDQVLVVTNHPAEYAFLGLPLFSDLIPGRGALGGLYTALAVATQPYVAVVACDMPFVNADLLKFQHELIESSDADVVVPRTGAGYEPLHAVYRRESCLPAIEAALERGDWKAVSWFPLVTVKTVDAVDVAHYDPHGLAFVNVNTPDELARIEQLAAFLSI